MRYFLIAFIFLIHNALGQNNASTKLNSPKATVNTFLKNLQEDNFKPEEAAKTLNPNYVKGIDKELIITQLKQVLDGAGVLIEADEIPDNPDYSDSTGQNRYYLTEIEFPDIYIEKQKSRWYFSKRTIQKVPELHQKIYPFGTDKLMNILPKMGSQRILGLHTWQYISILILIIICVLIHKVLSWFFDWLFFQLLKNKGFGNIAHDYILPVARPFSLLIIVGILIILVPVLQLPITFNHYFILLLNALLPLFGTIMAYKIVDILGEYMLKKAAQTETTMDDQIVPILKRVLKIFVIIIGFLYILNNLRFDITALLAGISIGGLAFALAAQDTIKNFFGSLMILFDKPFQIGDWVTAGDIDGTVEEVGFRSTRIRTFRNSLITVPNGKLADMAVDNHGLRKYRRFYTTITITYDTPPHLIEAFTKGLKRIVEDHPYTWKDFYHIYFNNMSAYSLDIMFYVFLDVPTWGEELKYKEELLFSIMKLAEKLGINFAFPTQTLHMENFPGQSSLSPQYQDQNEISKKLNDFFGSSNPK
ncbi:mechanosensitive ion channel family protein [Marivirga arenosa]|uniref:Mechanosensitive ion channel family protein n=1 Tax=Marivirga arenosa TaxID=3059076 RepID=A0AA51N4X5_9BACT|nr:mechanosensitive ion channel family protein [Marivirga sp. ABR2-2]WMN06371.1 mechanosensitive ion channel family protein [Marivirga sp. ABR2-2]